MLIAPSLLSCDFSRIGNEAERMEKAHADMLHFDVMDGHFVSNLTFGAPIVASVRDRTSLPFDVHLMISHPHKYAGDFIKAGADIITFHTEADTDIKETIKIIKSSGVRAGLVIKPQTPAEAVFEYLDDLYMVLVMTVEPGFGGQSFMEDMMMKVTAIKNEIKARGKNVLIQADGGINAQTIGKAAAAGVDIAVSGTGVFKAKDPALAIAELKKIADAAIACTGVNI